MKAIKINLRRLRFLAVFLSIYACALPSVASAQTAYYQGKTLTILRGGTPGGYGDLQARALIPYLKKYIPGDPTIVVENMPVTVSVDAEGRSIHEAGPSEWKRRINLRIDDR